jgi:uncharacterized protein YndB with AHSA1/START domain
MVKNFSVTTTICAPAERIWAILTDAPAYPIWNTTVSSVDGRIASGQTVTVHAKIAPGRAFPVRVVAFDAPRRMVWSSAMPLGLFRGERVFELRPQSDGVGFSMREEYTGALAGLIGKSIPDLQPAFDEFAACLKARAEAPPE